MKELFHKPNFYSPNFHGSLLTTFYYCFCVETFDIKVIESRIADKNVGYKFSVRPIQLQR